jgi:hypothetical protein
MIKIEGKPVEERAPLSVEEITPEEKGIQRKWIVKQGEQVLGYVIYKIEDDINRVIFKCSKKEENIVSTYDNVIDVKVEMEKKTEEGRIYYDLVIEVSTEPKSGAGIERKVITKKNTLAVKFTEST